MATAAQIAANQKNALKSTGPKTEEGKEVARRNALKHGLTGAGVVIPGEDEQEVALRITALEQQMGTEGDFLAGLMVRQIAIASIRAERAFRMESALTAERMRRAPDLFDDERLVVAEELYREISIDPISIRRRLLMAQEGVDVLLRVLRGIRAKSSLTDRFVWSDFAGRELDLCMGRMPNTLPESRVSLLSRGIASGDWDGLDPAEVEPHTGRDRLVWAVREIDMIIAAEIAALEAHRATIDQTRTERSRLEAGERALVDLSKEGQTLRRYAGAAERTMLKLTREIRIMRYEAELRAKTPEEATAMLEKIVTEMPPLQDIIDELGPFFDVARPRSQRQASPAHKFYPVDPKSSFLPISVGRAPGRPVKPGS